MATIKEVAEFANVSIATVSNHINRTKPVSKELASKIDKAIETLNYSPNISARSLKASVYTDIGIVLPNFDDKYYVQIFNGIEQTLQGTNYSINVAFSYDIPEVEENIIKNMLKKQICGLIIVTSKPNNWNFFYDNFTSQGKPVVTIDRSIKNLDANFISFDYKNMMLSLTKNLLKNDYTNLCLISGSKEFDSEESAISGFINAHNAYSVSDYSIITCDMNKENSFKSTVKLLSSNVPGGIILTSELMATGAVEALNLLGYDNIPVATLGEQHWNLRTNSFASFSAPRPAIKIGSTAAEVLLNNIQYPVLETQKIIFPNDILKEQGNEKIFSHVKKQAVSRHKRKINLLLLDTPVVHNFTGLIKNFEDTFGIETNIKILPHQKIYEAITEQNSFGAYDVVMFDIPWLGTLASKNILFDISDMLRTTDTGVFFKDCLKRFGEFNGRFYGLPFMYAPQMFYYRKDLFNNRSIQNQFFSKHGISLRPPITLKELNIVSEFFTNDTDVINYGMSVAAAYTECLAPEIHMRLQSYDSLIFDEKNNVVFDNPKTLKALINFKKALNFAKPNYLEATDVSIVDDFLNGETAMLITYPAFLTDISDLRKNSLLGSIGYSLIPGRTPLLGGWSMGVSNFSQSKQDAFSFIEWTCSPQISNYFSLMGGQTAITNTYTNDELVKMNPWLPLYYKAYEYTKFTASPTLQNGKVIPAEYMDEIICKGVYKLIKDELLVHQAISSIQDDLRKLLEHMDSSLYP